jgi:hypothetical protein
MTRSSLQYLDLKAEITGGWRNFCNKLLHNLHLKGHHIKEDKVEGVCSTQGSDE